MNKKAILFAVLCTLTVCSAAAQQLYKSVGADGKVTFSDKMTKDDKAKVSVMRGNILRPTDVEPTPLPTLATPSRLRPNQSPSQVAAVPRTATATTPELEFAVTEVMMMTEVARRFEPMCSATPTTAKEYSSAVTGWRQRNANFIEQQTRILMEVYSPIKRAELENKVTSRSDAAFHEVRGLSPEWRTKWCNKAVLDMRGRLNDVANNAAVAVPLITFKP